MRKEVSDCLLMKCANCNKRDGKYCKEINDSLKVYMCNDFSDGLNVFKQAVLKEVKNIPKFFDRNIESFTMDQLNEMRTKLHQILLNGGHAF